MRNADDGGLVDDADIAVVEAAGGGAEHKQLARAQTQTAVAAWQRAARAITWMLPCSTVQGRMIHRG